MSVVRDAIRYAGVWWIITLLVILAMLSLGAPSLASPKYRVEATVKPLEAEMESLDSILDQMDILSAKKERILAEASLVHQLTKEQRLDYDRTQQVFVVYSPVSEVSSTTPVSSK